jgi:hypothetical protein
LGINKSELQMEKSKNLRKVAFPVPFDPFFLPNQCYGLHTIIDMG